MKTRPPSFSMGTFQGTPASFSPMAAPGSTASPSSAAYPNLSGRSAGFSECSMGCWGGRRGAAPHKAQPGCTPCSLLVGDVWVLSTAASLLPLAAQTAISV